MSVRDIIKDLVTGQYSSDLDYIHTKFSFRTVFYRSSFSCCCCSCAFEHEYLEYISDEGQINEEIFAKIIKSIEDGMCPHVAQATPDKVRETGIYAIHIAAAVGTKTALLRHIDDYKEVKGEIFQLEPYMIAALKSNHKSLGLYCDGFRKIYHPTTVRGLKFLHASRTEKLSYKVNIEMTSLLEFCVQKNKSALLKSVLLPHITHFYMQRAYCQVYQRNLIALRDELLNYDINSLNFRLDAGESFDAPACVEPAILCNEPDVLTKVLKFTDSNRLNPFVRSIYASSCYVLERTECLNILQKQNIVESTYEMSVPSSISHSLYLMQFYKERRAELNNVLRNLPNVGQAINLPVHEGDELSPVIPTMPALHSYITSYRYIDPEIVKTLLDLGADVDIQDSKGNTALICLLKRGWWIHTGFRETLEMILFENPSCCLNENALKFGLKFDVYMQSNWQLQLENMEGDYIMSCEEYSLFSYTCKDVENYALNFTLPLLIECGLPTTHEFLLEVLEASLHPTELAYIRKCLAAPRSLKLMCRDVIRQYYKGRCLHNFLEISIIAASIKDYILLRSELLFIYKFNVTTSQK